MKRHLRSVLCSILLASCLFPAFETNAYAQTQPIILEEDSSDLPEEVREEVLKNLQPTITPIESKIKDGIIVSPDDVMPMAPPNDGYYYSPVSVLVDNYKKLPKYKYIGYAQVRNYTSSNMSLTYEQEESKTVNWNVAAAISGNTTIGNHFLGKIETKVGVDVSRSSTVSSGTRIGATATCSPRHKLTLTAYKGGVYTEARIVYHKYHPRGGQVGAYTETVSGTAVRVHGLTLTAVETSL